MALAETTPVKVYDHATLPIRFILQTDGVHVYSDGKLELFLPAADVNDLAAAVQAFYTTPTPAPVTAPV